MLKVSVSFVLHFLSLSHLFFCLLHSDWSLLHHYLVKSQKSHFHFQHRNRISVSGFDLIMFS